MLIIVLQHQPLSLCSCRSLSIVCPACHLVVVQTVLQFFPETNLSVCFHNLSQWTEAVPFVRPADRSAVFFS
jgi:hypothetical protein